MADAEMVDYLRRCALSPDQPRPSIETLLHAFIPAAHVDHTHPDAVIALTATPNGRWLAEEVFGDEAIWLTYQRLGFDLSKRIAELLDASSSARAVLLEKHGLVTWGERSEEAYRWTLAFVGRAADALAHAGGGRLGLGGQTVRTLGDTEAEAQALPVLRGTLLEDAAFRRGVGEYARWYRDYYERNLTDESRPFLIDPAGPRVVLVPGLGILTSGADARRARFARDLYHRAIAVQDAADAAGGFRSLSEPEAFAIEYWPLERYKLTQAPCELAGRIALITGAASGIGRAAARRLAELGAQLVVADLNGEGAETVAEELREGHGGRSAVAVRVDVSDEQAVLDMVRQTVLAYGGLDVLVCSAGLATSAPVTETTLEDWERNHSVLARGYFLPAREAFRVLLQQGRGGSVVIVGSKKALVAGANAAACSSAKATALHLARCLAEEGGKHGIRVNTVNPDAVIERIRDLVVRVEGRAREHLRR